MIPRIILRAVPVLVLLVLIPLLFLLSFTVRPPSPQPDVTQDASLPERRIVENLGQNRPLQALYHIETLAANAGWTPILQQQAGDVWREIGDTAAALVYWERAAQTRTNDPVLLRRIAVANVDLQRWTAAVDSLKALAAFSPTDSWVNYQLGLLLAPFDPRAAARYLSVIADSIMYGETARALLEIVRADPANPSIPMQVGLALAARDLWPYAQLAFDHAATVPGLYAEASAYAGLSRDRQGKDGSQWIGQAVAAAPENALVRFLEGLHFRAVGDYAASLGALVKAQSLDPSSPALYAEVSTAYRLLGDLRQAEYWLQLAVAVSGNAQQFRDLLAQFYLEYTLP